MPQLPLHGGYVAGLIHYMPAHGMPGRMGGLAFYMSQLADLVRDGVDVHGIQTTEALGPGVGREEESV